MGFYSPPPRDSGFSVMFWGIALVFVLLTLLLGSVAYVSRTSASEPAAPVTQAIPDQHDRGDFLPCVLNRGCTWLINRTINRGYVTYALDDRTANFVSGNGISARQEIEAIFRDRCLNTGICFLEVPYASDYDLAFEAPDSWCCPGAAGLAFYASTPAFIEWNWRLPYWSFKTTFSHECGHAGCAIIEDLYKHPGTCLPERTWTVMSCATAVWLVTEYDKHITWNVYVPDAPSATAFRCDAAYCFIEYNYLRKSSVGCVLFSGAEKRGGNPSERDNYCGHYSAQNDVATRAAFFYRDRPSESWTSVSCAAEFNYCFGPAPDPSRMVGRGFARAFWCPPGREWAVNLHNNLRISWPREYGGVGQISGDYTTVGTCP